MRQTACTGLPATYEYIKNNDHLFHIPYMSSTTSRLEASRILKNQNNKQNKQQQQTT